MSELIMVYLDLGLKRSDTFSYNTGGNVGSHERVGYRINTSHYYPKIGDIRGDRARCGSRSEENIQSYLFNVEESVDSDGIIG